MFKIVAVLVHNVEKLLETLVEGIYHVHNGVFQDPFEKNNLKIVFVKRNLIKEAPFC